MRLNPLLMEKLAGPEEYAAGRDLEEIGAVKIAEEDKGMIRCTVAGQGPHSVTLTSRSAAPWFCLTAPAAPFACWSLPRATMPRKRKKPARIM